MAETPPSVLMVSAGFHPQVGGAEKQALELSVALAARGVRVRVVTRRLPGLARFEEVRGVPVERLWCAGDGLLNAATFMASLTLRLLLRSSDYTVLHAHLAGSPALAAALCGRLLSKRVFVKLGGGKGIGELAASSKTVPGRLKLLALRWLAPDFVAVAKELASEAASYLGPVPVHVMPNGVDVQTYRPAGPPRKRELRAKLGLPREGLGFVYAGRLSPEKRLPAFFEAWLDAGKDSRAKPFFAVAGAGVEARVLQDTAARRRAQDRLFLLGELPRVEEAYAANDVFVLPSVSEGLSNALLEAMASGLAVLGSRVGGTAEAVEEGKTGLLFSPHDDGELKRQLAKLLENPALAASLGEAARRAALERYSMEKVAKAWEDLYRWGL